MIRIGIAYALTSIALMMNLWTGSQAPTTALDYDTYCKLPDATAKQQAVSKAPDAAKAEILREHYRRFLEANRARLNSEQVAFLQQMIDLLTPATSKPPLPKELYALSEKQPRLFSAQDHLNLLPDSGCIPKRSR